MLSKPGAGGEATARRLRLPKIFCKLLTGDQLLGQKLGRLKRGVDGARCIPSFKGGSQSKCPFSNILPAQDRRCSYCCSFPTLILAMTRATRASTARFMKAP